MVVEIISPDDPDRDLIDKRHDYATAGIAEYWIIDPRDDSIQVFHLRDGTYSDGIRAISGQSAESKVLSGFRTDVAELFARARA